jgi:hypothetical protein
MDPEFDLPAFDMIVQDRFSNRLFPPHILSYETEERPTTTQWSLNSSGRYEARTILLNEINPLMCVIL